MTDLKVWVLYHVWHGLGSRMLRRVIEFRARLRGTAFACRALSGESDYNVSINANCTVSCNCVDRDGAGVIGDLKTQTFSEIWFGPKANAFRDNLACGKLPIRWCANCCELREVRRG
jgi:hypothetical protein